MPDVAGCQSGTCCLIASYLSPTCSDAFKMLAWLNWEEILSLCVKEIFSSWPLVLCRFLPRASVQRCLQPDDKQTNPQKPLRNVGVRNIPPPSLTSGWRDGGMREEERGIRRVARSCGLLLSGLAWPHAPPPSATTPRPVSVHQPELCQQAGYMPARR